MALKLIKDRYNRISILGEKMSCKPDPAWLDMQNIPFKSDAVFHSAYPLDGGACTVDINDVEILRDVELLDIAKSHDGGGMFNPAYEKILELWTESGGISPETKPEDNATTSTFELTVTYDKGGKVASIIEQLNDALEDMSSSVYQGIDIMTFDVNETSSRDHFVDAGE